MVVTLMVFVEVGQVSDALVIAAAIVAIMVTGGGGSLSLGSLEILCRRASKPGGHHTNPIWMRWLATGYGGSGSVSSLSKWQLYCVPPAAVNGATITLQ